MPTLSHPHDDWGDFALRVFHERYSFNGTETWPELAKRVSATVFSTVKQQGQQVDNYTREVENLIASRQFLPGGRYLYASGRPLHQTQNCLLMLADDSREGWANLYWQHVMGLSTGAGIGTVYSLVRPKGAKLNRTGGVAGGPLNLALGINEAAHTVRQGGDRRAALWSGLHWWHEDVQPYIVVKDWLQHVRDAKAADWNASAPLDYTNQSVCYDDAFFAAMSPVADANSIGSIRQCERGAVYGMGDDVQASTVASTVYWQNIAQAMRTGDPGISVDVGDNHKEWLRNACTELCAYSDSDICNIGSLNLARFDTLDQFRAALEPAVAFLLAGTEYSDVPYPKVADIRKLYRRLGLGLMGVHEWLLKRGKKYGPDAELEQWLQVYAESTAVAHRLAGKWSLSRPVKTRAMAPNGTIGIVAETTTCMEPLLTVAYKRRVKKGDATWAQYVVDPVAQRLIKTGIRPDDIETAYSLAESPEGVERRVAFQAWFQRYVDHGISSTINVAAWGSPSNNEDTVRPFGEMLLKYMSKLRGITVYPDGARGGQPITQVHYETALKHGSEVVFEQGDVCDLRGGSCGS